MKKILDFISSVPNFGDKDNSHQYYYGIDLASSIINSSTDAIIICEAEPSPRIVYVNETFIKETGYSSEDVLGQNPRILQGPRTDPATRGRIRDALKAWQPIREDILNYKKNSEEFWVSLSIFPIANQSGWFTHWISIQHNITESKKREVELLSAKAQLIISNTKLSFQNEEKQKRADELDLANQEFRIAAHIFNSQEGMMVIDANQVILRVNRAFTKITGYSEADTIGHTPRILSSGKQDKAFYTKMWESINKLGTWEGEIWNRHKNGEIYPHYLTIAAVINDAGSITNFVATFTDISRDIAAANEIKNLAFYDPLTQLPNRRLLLDRLNQALMASKRTGKRGALIFLDLDHFKNLNDTLGHSMGDLLLQQVATRLKNSIRESDTVARFGGDEFVILLEAINEDAIECAVKTKDFAEKIMSNLNKSYQLKEHLYTSNSSIGVTFFNGDELTADELLKQADIAMYQAKNSGRNTFRFFENEMQETITSLVNLERELANAIEQEHLELYYQLQVDIEGQILGAEALVRWLHNERGVILPSLFIPLAEESGLMLPLGKWVLEAACRQLKIWEENSFTCALTLSVNISIKQFSQADFADQVKAILQRYAINPTRLKLELTESAFIKNIESVILTMGILRGIGIQFELDDFGTGYSSLQYLKKLPLERLKIDQSFVRDIESDDNDKQIVLTIIAMAKNLGLSVIAEGVETEGQQLILKNNGCLHYQGYLFGKPLPIAQFERSLSNS